MTHPSRQQILRAIILATAALTSLALLRAWFVQRDAPISCNVAFAPLGSHNGYLQLNLKGQHPSEEILESEIFLYFPESQSPPQTMTLTRLAAGDYAKTIMKMNLVPFSQGRALSEFRDFDLPTPGTSHRQFPLDSPRVATSIAFDPPIRPSSLIVRNFSPDFMPICESLKGEWQTSGILDLSIELQRNPFVQYAIVIVSLAALLFGVALVLIRSPLELIQAAAAYFFSVWSIRGIAAPAILTFPTLLDLWLLLCIVVALFLIAWRATSSDEKDSPAA